MLFHIPQILNRFFFNFKEREGKRRGREKCDDKIPFPRRDIITALLNALQSNWLVPCGCVAALVGHSLAYFFVHVCIRYEAYF